MLIVNSGPRAWMYGLFFGAAAGAALVGLTASPFRLPRAGALSSLDRTDYGVAAIAPGQLARNLMMRGPLVRVLDVRPEHEFAVSRIPGSVHAEAGTSAEAFLLRYGSQIQGKSIVVVAPGDANSVATVQRVALLAREAGARSVQSLAGGIVAWANEGRWLRDDKGLTSRVHPGAMAESLRRPALARYEPRS